MIVNQIESSVMNRCRVAQFLLSENAAAIQFSGQLQRVVIENQNQVSSRAKTSLANFIRASKNPAKATSTTFQSHFAAAFQLI